MANGFDLYGGSGFMPMETPTYGGGLLQPPTPPQPQGLGLLPLIVGALGSAADPSFGKNFLYGLGMRQQQAQNNYRNQMQNYRLQRQDQMQQMKLEQMRSAAEAEARQRAGLVQALRDRNIPESQIPLYLANDDAMKSLFREEKEPTLFERFADPEQRPLVESFFEAKRQPAVQVHTGPSWVPSGFLPVNPNDPTAGVVPIAGGPQDPQAKAAAAAATDQAKREEQQADARRMLDEANAGWEAAQAAYEADRNPENARKAREAAQAVALARQNLLNLGRELSGPMQRDLTPPSGVQRDIEKAVGELMRGLTGGGDPEPAQQPSDKVNNLLKKYGVQ